MADKPTSIWIQVDRAVEALEAALRNGERPPLTALLPPATSPAYAAVLGELIRVDLEHRWRHGDARPLATYLDEFPALRSDPATLAAVAFEEYRQRRVRGDQPSPEEYRRRYGIDTADWPAPGTSTQVRPHLDSGAPAGSGPRSAVVPSMPPPDGTRQTPLDPSPAPPRFPRVGDSFCGFRLIGELGRGAFAKVYLAQQGDLANRPVALKVTADLSQEPEALARLQHTNIVPIYSVHQEGPLLAVCMPFLGATTLADVIRCLHGEARLPRSGKYLVSTLQQRRHSSWPSAPSVPTAVLDASARPGDVPGGAAIRVGTTTEILDRYERLSFVEAILWLAARLADGLDHAHERGIIHRDLKPANILLTDEGQPMLLDFNLSEDRHQTGFHAARLGGTLPYMAPEHLEAYRGDPGKCVDARSDLYSLGLILFELLTGRHPFALPAGQHLGDPLGTMIAQRRGAPPSLRQLNRAVTPAVEAIINRCLEPDPARRYPSARALREDLERHLADLPLRHTPEPSLAERCGKWARRHPQLTSVTSITLLAVLLLGLLGAGWWSRGRQLARVAAEQQYHEFRAQKREAEALIGIRYPDLDLTARGAALARDLLDRYGILGAEPWTGAPAVQDLPEADRRTLREEAADLLFLLARAEGLKARLGPAEQQRKHLEEGLRLNLLAAACLDGRPAPAALVRQGQQLRRQLNGGGVTDDPMAVGEGAREATLAASDLFALGRIREALPLARRATEADPTAFWGWFLVGSCHLAAGDDARAEQAFGTCVALAPEFPWGWFDRGLARLRLRQYAAARQDFTRLIALRPTLAEAYLNRALARQGEADLRGAAADLEKALEHGAAPTRVYLLRARVYEALGERDRAAADQARGLEATPADEPSWVARGIARLRAGDPPGALADFEAALRLNPASFAALQNTAHVLSEVQHRPREAIAVLNRLLDLNPEFVPARGGRAVLLARIGDRPSAQEDAEACLRLDPGPATAYQVAGVYALTAGQEPADRAEALRLLAAALGKGYGLEDVDSDPDLEPLRADEAFQRLVTAAKTLAARKTAPAGPRP